MASHGTYTALGGWGIQHFLPQLRFVILEAVYLGASRRPWLARGFRGTHGEKKGKTEQKTLMKPQTRKKNHERTTEKVATSCEKRWDSEGGVPISPGSQWIGQLQS